MIMWGYIFTDQNSPCDELWHKIIKNYGSAANLNLYFHILNNFTRFKTFVHVLKTPKLTYVFQALLTKKKKKKK